MRNGILFFLGMDKVRTLSRIALLPVFFIMLYVEFGSVLFFLCIGILVLSAFLSFLPTPTEKKLQIIISDYQAGLKEHTLRAAAAKNVELMTIVNGYQKRGKMLLKRQIGKDMIYPHLSSLSLYRKDKSYTLVLGTKSLLSVAPPVYKKLLLDSNTVVFPSDTDAEKVIELTVRDPETSEELIMYVKNDYHYRDFLTAIKPILN